MDHANGGGNGTGADHVLEPGISRQVEWRPDASRIGQIVSRAYSMRGCTSVRLGTSVVGSGPVGLEVQLEESEEQVDWQELRRVSVAPRSEIELHASGMNSKFVRVRCTLTGISDSGVGISATLTGMVS